MGEVLGVCKARRYIHRAVADMDDTIMEEKRGRFVQGAWVEEDRPQGEVQGEKPIDQRIEQVSANVTTSLHQVLALARDLITTPDGHAHIERQIHHASSRVEDALSEIIKSGEEKMTGKSSAGNEKKIRIE